MRAGSVSELLSLVDSSVLDKAALLSNVDYNAKKLKGAIVFKLLLMSLLDSNKMSLRMMEQLYASHKFRLATGLDVNDSVRYSSLSERLSCIEVAYFETIFQQLLAVSQTRLVNGANTYHIRQFDSTTISASAKLLKKGMSNGLRNKQGEHSYKQIKFTVGLRQNIPSGSLMFTQQQHLAEDETLKLAILNSSLADNEIAVFDRGLKARKTYQEFKQNNILFVTRTNPTKSIKVLQQNTLPDNCATATLTILGDEQVHLFCAKKTKVKEVFRLIRARSKATGEELLFLTNIEDLPATEITNIYRQRWDIEVFFKFLKQYLHFKHFFSYSENGIKVMMYMSMIAAILLLLYKKENNIASYKAAKFAFVEALDIKIIREIVILCGGDPAKSPFLNTT